MKNHSTFLAIMLFIGMALGGHNAFSHNRLGDIFDYADELYSIGMGNNYLSYAVGSFDEFVSMYPPEIIWDLLNPHDLFIAVQACAFLHGGVLGPYLTPPDWLAISRELTDSLAFSVESEGLEFIVVDQPFAIGGGLISSPCALGIIDGDDVLLIQGQGVE